MTPRLQRSQALSYPALSKSSGAAYCSVKQGVCRGALPAGHRRANPKSITFSMESSPSSANSTFCKIKISAHHLVCLFTVRLQDNATVFTIDCAIGHNRNRPATCTATTDNICSGMFQATKAQFTSGFRSLCTTPASCMKLTADTRLCSSWLASASPNSFFLLILSSNSPPRKSSITKYVWYWQKRPSTMENSRGHLVYMATLFVQSLISVVIKASTWPTVPDQCKLRAAWQYLGGIRNVSVQQSPSACLPPS